MPFENARISKAEYDEHELAKIDKRYPLSNCSSSWTIDRERNIHMRCVTRSVPPEMGSHEPLWLFFWQKAYVIFQVQIQEHATKSNGWVAHKSLVRLDIPEVLSARRAQIVQDIEAALRAYGTGGIHCRAENFKLTFEVCV